MSEHQMVGLGIAVLGILGSWLAHMAGKQAGRIGHMEFELMNLRALAEVQEMNKRHTGKGGKLVLMNGGKKGQ